ncbi:MAG: phage terminase large subunit [bacterium]
MNTTADGGLTAGGPPAPGDEAWRIGAAKAHPLGWASYVDRSYTRPKHVKLLAEHLLKAERGEIKRLMVMMPPRHSKSETTTVKFPAWYLGRHPDHRVIIASHTASLAARFSLRARNDFAQFAPEIWGLEVDPGVGAMYRWDVLDKKAPPGDPPGGMIAAGIGGPITGHGAHLVVIDDPVKDAAAAASEVQREAIWDWYRFVLRTRLFPDASIILVLTRWHEDDLAGRLLDAAANDPTADQWAVLRLPALAEAGDALGRAPGEALWPEQYSAAALLATKASVGSYVWEALYQQRPSPGEGALIKRDWWKYYERLPECERQLQSWDCTFKDSDGTDFVVGQVWGVQGGCLYLLDQVRARMDFVRTVEAIRAMARKWPQAVTKLVEDKANGPAVIAMLRNKVAGLIPVEPKGSKLARASAVTPLIEAGNVYLPKYAPWVSDFVGECAAFPQGAFDDQVDAMSQALARYMYIASVWGQEEEDCEPVYPKAFGRTNY